jgi:hypothetical protein
MKYIISPILLVALAMDIGKRRDGKGMVHRKRGWGRIEIEMHWKVRMTSNSGKWENARMTSVS